MATAYGVANDKVFALNASGGRPRCRRSRLHEFWRLAFKLRIFLNSLDGDLERSSVRGSTTNTGLMSYHCLFKSDKLSNHEQQVIDDRRSERQGKAGKSSIHVRENCDEGNTADDEAGKDVETRRDPPVHCKKTQSMVRIILARRMQLTPPHPVIRTRVLAGLSATAEL